MLGRKGRAVIAIEPLAEAEGGQGVAEGVQQLGGVLTTGEAPSGEDAGVVVDDPAEDRLAFGGANPDQGSMHEVADPEVVGMGHFVFGAGLVEGVDRPVEAALLEEPAQGGLADALSGGPTLRSPRSFSKAQYAMPPPQKNPD